MVKNLDDFEYGVLQRLDAIDRNRYYRALDILAL
jgi:hypothetical protein